MKVKFLKPYLVMDEKRNDPVNRTSYSVNQVVEMDEASYKHFLGKGLVEAYVEPKPAPKPEVKVEVKAEAKPVTRRIEAE